MFRRSNSGPASAPVSEAPAQATPAATETVKSDKDRMVCKTEALAGSRVPKKICATKGEWDSRRQADRDQLEKAQKAANAPRGF